ncbi:MAG TPA: BBP7 family outer membrane beta-barrel protein [Pirellulales bacterium]|nr:BBP7 family outer membrane beta-barrel protein [Pirellulales bacterium]
MLLAALTSEAGGQAPPYPQSNGSDQAGAAFAPPDARPPQTAQPRLAMQPPSAARSAPVVPAPNSQPLYAPRVAGQAPYSYTPMSPPPYPPPSWQPGPYQPPPNQPALPSSVYEITSKFWFRPDILLWWSKSDPMPQPLVTTGSPADALPGALGQPGTQVVYGGNSINFGLTGGLRLETGLWLDDNRRYGLELGYFFLGMPWRRFSDWSDGYGSPVIARPTIDAASGTEGSYVDALPGYVSGGVDVITRSQFQGANVDGAWNLVQTDGLRFDALLGFRYLSLVESLGIFDEFSEVTPGSITFAGAPIRASDVLTDLDHFRLSNSFYGGSLGGRLYLARGRWLITALGKVALGTVQQRASIYGSTTLTDWYGNQTVLPGGILATTANMGNHYQSPFAVAPEAHFNVGYQIRPWVTLRVGYSFLFLSNVARPGNQVSRVTSANLIPTDPAYGTAGPNQPAFQFHTSSYWAQGLNLGLDFRF